MINTEKHLTIEEELLKASSYPDMEAHIQAHNIMRNKIKDFEFKDTNKNLSQEILIFLKDWWINHIKVMDKKYEKFLSTKLKA